MKIRGDLKIYRDLLVTTAAKNAAIGKYLVAKNTDGVVKWNDLQVYAPNSVTVYPQGTLVIDTATGDLHIAKKDNAPGDELTHVNWLNVSSGGGGGNVEFYASSLPVAGTKEVIYVLENTGSLYTWDGSQYVYISGGIPIEQKATLDVGGIKKYDTVMQGVKLDGFIDQLISPAEEPEITDPVYYDFYISNIPSMKIGTAFTPVYVENFFKGTADGWNSVKNKLTVNIKGDSTQYDHIPAAGAIYVVKPENAFIGSVIYSSGVPALYNSTGNLSFINRGYEVTTYTENVKGWYQGFIGMDNSNTNNVVNALQSGSQSANSWQEFEYIKNTDRRIDTVLVKKIDQDYESHTHIYVALPANQFTFFEVVTESNEVITTLADFIRNFSIVVGTTTIPMQLYSVNINGFTNNMNAELIITK